MQGYFVRALVPEQKLIGGVSQIHDLRFLPWLQKYKIRIFEWWAVSGAHGVIEEPPVRVRWKYFARRVRYSPGQERLVPAGGRRHNDRLGGTIDQERFELQVLIGAN